MQIDEVFEGIRGEVTRQERDPKHYKAQDIALCDDIRDKAGEVANDIEWGRADPALKRQRMAEIAVLAIRSILREDVRAGGCDGDA